LKIHSMSHRRRVPGDRGAFPRKVIPGYAS
jgi:hypothetical protein